MKRVVALMVLAAIIVCIMPLRCAAISPAEADDITNAILAQKENYPEGMLWSARTPAFAYTWGFKGSLIAMTGCAAFAAIMQDTVFGSIRESEPSWQKVNTDCVYVGFPENSVKYSWSNLYPGDIIRFDGHTVMVLTKGKSSVTVVEGNYGGTVHWGREISRTTIEKSAKYIITRYDKGPAMFSLALPSENHWTYDSIRWGIDKGIADNDLTRDSETIDCTRAEMIYALWLAQQRPTNIEDPVFADIPEGAIYKDAVAWAYANGITFGTSKHKFSPNQPCTRAQIVTLLYRAIDPPDDFLDTENPFTDVSSDEYYYNAILWAASEGIAKGKTSARFSPNDRCSKEEMIVFLYRAVKFYMEAEK